jgi:hypothetical protein
LSAFYGFRPSIEEGDKLVKLILAFTHSLITACIYAFVLRAADLGASFTDTADVGGYSTRLFAPNYTSRLPSCNHFLNDAFSAEY